MNLIDLMGLSRFQPTLPLRGATEETHELGGLHGVSTHAPLAGSDLTVSMVTSVPRGFNPRSPCGERPLQPREHLGPIAVSTHAPLAGSDERRRPPLEAQAVSTHAPLAGSDRAGAARGTPRQGFNPRSPCGERPGPLQRVQGGHRVSTHAPLAGSDRGRWCSRCA